MPKRKRVEQTGSDPAVPKAGRPEATTHARIEQVAFELFAEQGFERTTMDDIARGVGVGRRTLFRYYPSKNDIPWGQFDQTLEWFRELFAAMPSDLPLYVTVQRAVLAFNDFPVDARPPHRERMALILGTPALQAHSVLRYAQWRAVIADYVAAREGLSANDLLPTTVAHVALALAVTAYEHWLADPDSDLAGLLDEALRGLRGYLLT